MPMYVRTYMRVDIIGKIYFTVCNFMCVFAKKSASDNKPDKIVIKYGTVGAYSYAHAAFFCERMHVTDLLWEYDCYVKKERESLKQ